MGILRHGDALKPKYPTAFIEGYGIIVPVRIVHKISDIFLVNIQHHVLAFSLKDVEQFTYRPGEKDASTAYFFSIEHVISIQSWERDLQKMGTGQPLDSISLDLMEAFAATEKDDTIVDQRDMDAIVEQLETEYNNMSAMEDSGSSPDISYGVRQTALVKRLAERSPADVMPFSARRVVTDIKRTLTEAQPNIADSVTDPVSSTSLKRPNAQKWINHPLSAKIDWAKIAFVTMVVGILITFMIYGNIFNAVYKYFVPPPPPPPPPPPVDCSEEALMSRYADDADPAMSSAVAYITKVESCPPPPDLQDVWLLLDPRDLRYELLKSGNIAPNQIDAIMGAFWDEISQ